MRHNWILPRIRYSEQLCRSDDPYIPALQIIAAFQRLVSEMKTLVISCETLPENSCPKPSLDVPCSAALSGLTFGVWFRVLFEEATRGWEAQAAALQALLKRNLVDYNDERVETVISETLKFAEVSSLLLDTTKIHPRRIQVQGSPEFALIC